MITELIPEIIMALVNPIVLHGASSVHEPNVVHSL